MRPLWMLQAGVETLSAHKLRTFLSVLGVVIGVAAVVAIVAMIQGVTAWLQGEIAGLGLGIVSVDIRMSEVHEPFPVDEFTTALGAAPAAASVAPVHQVFGAQALLEGPATKTRYIYRDGELIGIFEVPETSPKPIRKPIPIVVGTTPAFSVVFDHYPARGRFLHPLDEGQAVIVLGAGVARDLFGGEDPVSKTLTVELSGQAIQFLLVGVMEPRGIVANYNLDQQVYIPLKTLQDLTDTPARLTYVARAKSEAEVDAMVAQLRRTLDWRMTLLTRGLEDLVSYHTLPTPEGRRVMFVQDPSSLPSQPYSIGFERELAELFAQSSAIGMGVLGGIAAISLLVGGIGIMNIMLVSVAERTREVGIRMAVGARPKDIRWQFLFESVSICLLGGLIGLGLGWAVALIGALLGGWPLLISPLPAGVAFGVSALVGIVFGTYPARRAARLDPVEALRYE